MFEEVIVLKRALYMILVIILISAFTACIAEEIPEEALNRLKEHCYINPDGGERLHTDQNCRSVHEKYLPLTEVEFSDELLKQYSLCPVCTLADEPQEEPAAPADPALVISEAERRNCRESHSAGSILWQPSYRRCLERYAGDCFPIPQT